MATGTEAHRNRLKLRSHRAQLLVAARQRAPHLALEQVAAVRPPQLLLLRQRCDLKGRLFGGRAAGRRGGRAAGRRRAAAAKAILSRSTQCSCPRAHRSQQEGLGLEQIVKVLQQQRGDAQPRQGCYGW